MTGIILYGSFELAPYSKKYMNILERSGEKYDLIGWRREEIPQYAGDNVYMYGGEAAKRYSSPTQKIKPAFGFRRYVKDIINKKNYDRLIILTTQTALMLSDVLLGRYKNRYIFDYRDRSYEYIMPYRTFVNSIIKKSVETVISSPWFADVLTDKKQYILAHNMPDEYNGFYKKTLVKKDPSERLSVGYIGALRAYDYHRQLIDTFADDSRFEFHTYGCGDDTKRLSEYAAKFDNIYIHGAYKEEDKYKIINTFDIMSYNYPYNFVNAGLVANRYYDSLIMKKPMFVNPKSEHGKKLIEMNMAVGIDQDADLSACADKIYKWYNTLDAVEFAEKCDLCLDKYIKENEMFEDKIAAALTRR